MSATVTSRCPSTAVVIYYIYQGTDFPEFFLLFLFIYFVIFICQGLSASCRVMVQLQESILKSTLFRDIYVVNC
jgi:hypothetical protein